MIIYYQIHIKFELIKTRGSQVFFISNNEVLACLTNIDSRALWTLPAPHSLNWSCLSFAFKKYIYAKWKLPQLIRNWIWNGFQEWYKCITLGLFITVDEISVFITPLHFLWIIFLYKSFGKLFREAVSITRFSFSESSSSVSGNKKVLWFIML